MGGKSGAKEAKAEAARIRADEEARQQRIRQGTSSINQIFSGGTGKVGTGDKVNLGNYDPKKTYYTSTGEVWKPPATGWGKALQEGVYSSVADAPPGAFTEDFFTKRAKAFTDYATPQLESQRGDAAKDLVFALTRSGNLDSSTRATKEGELQKLYDIQRQGIIDQGQAYANTARTNVEDARSDLIKTLNATGDAQGAASGAINRASALSAPDKFDPLSQLFADFTASLGSQYALERSEANAQKDYARHNLGLFKPGRTTVTGN
jgi:hypothetical protein